MTKYKITFVREVTVIEDDVRVYDIPDGEDPTEYAENELAVGDRDWRERDFEVEYHAVESVVAMTKEETFI